MVADQKNVGDQKKKRGSHILSGLNSKFEQPEKREGGSNCGQKGSSNTKKKLEERQKKRAGGHHKKIKKRWDQILKVEVLSQNLSHLKRRRATKNLERKG